MWKLRSLVREGLRNLGPRHLAVGLIAAGLIGSGGSLTAAQAASAVAQEQAIIQAGGTVWWIQSDASGEAIPARVCASLRTSGGVVGAGAVGESPDLWRVVGLDSPVSVDLGTVGLWGAWGRQDLEGRIVVGSDVAELGQVGVGTVLTNSRGEVTVDARTDMRVRPSRLRANVIIPNAGDFALSECWVRMEPAAFQSGRDLVVSAFAGYPVKIQAFANQVPAVLSPAQQWNRFASLSLWLYTGLLSGATVWLLAWTRRTELAVYRTFGTTRAELLVLIGTEAMLTLAPATAMALAVLVWTASVNDQFLTMAAADPVALADTLLVGVRAIAAGSLVGWIVGTVAAFTTTGMRIAEDLKDR